MAGNKDDVPGFDISGKSNPLEEFRGSEQGTRYGKLLSRLRAGHWLGEERNTYLSLRHRQELIQDSLKPSAHVPKNFQEVSDFLLLIEGSVLRDHILSVVKY